jgi:hypothetical protein
VVADYLGLSGDAYYGLGRYRESAESLRSALPIFRDHFMRRHHGLCLLKMGYAYEALGDHHAAIRHLRESQASSTSCSWPSTRSEHAMHSTPARTLSALRPAGSQMPGQTACDLARVRIGGPVGHDDHLAPAGVLGLVEGRVSLTDQLGQGTP